LKVRGWKVGRLKMATIERFEDIEARRDGRTLVKRIYEVTSEGRFANDFALRDQLRGAAISTMSNIAEGFERSTNKDFVRFLYMAKGSSGEVRAQLYAAIDLGYVDGQQGRQLLGLAETVSRRIAGFIKYLKSVTRNTGQDAEDRRRMRSARLEPSNLSTLRPLNP